MNPLYIFFAKKFTFLLSIVCRLDPCRLHSRGHPGVWREYSTQF